jgi:hypothetical protein
MTSLTPVAIESASGNRLARMIASTEEPYRVAMPQSVSPATTWCEIGPAGFGAVGAGRGTVEVAGMVLERKTGVVGIAPVGVDVTTAIGVPAGWRGLAVGDAWATVIAAPETADRADAGFVPKRAARVGDGAPTSSLVVVAGPGVEGMPLAEDAPFRIGEASRVAVTWASAVGVAAVVTPVLWASVGCRRGEVSMRAQDASASQLEVTDREAASVTNVASRVTSLTKATANAQVLVAFKPSPRTSDVPTSAAPMVPVAIRIKRRR